jgi:hypothetical protein
MRWWLRNLAAGLLVGVVVGVLVGGTLGRLFMRLVFLAQRDALGFQTAMGAFVGEFTRGGTTFVYVFGGLAGFVLGLAYALTRPLLPSRPRIRTAVFTAGTTAFMVGQIVRGNRDDFTFLPVTLSLVLVALSVALTAVCVPALVERLAPDRPRSPGRFASGIVAAALTAVAVFGATGVAAAYAA